MAGPMTKEHNRSGTVRRTRLSLGTWLLLGALAGPVSLSVSPAHAQDYAAAGQHFDAAQEAFAAGKFELAAKEYQAAFAITKETTLLQNIGESWQRAGNQGKALASYKAYLQAAPQAPDRVAIEERVKAIEAAQAEAAKPAPPAPAPAQPPQLPGQPAAVPGQPPQLPSPPSAASGQPSAASGVTSAAPGVTSAAPGVTSAAPGVTSAAPGVTTRRHPHSHRRLQPSHSHRRLLHSHRRHLHSHRRSKQDQRLLRRNHRLASYGSRAGFRWLRLWRWSQGGAVIGLGAQSRADELRRRTTLLVGDQPLRWSDSEAEAYNTLMSEGKTYNTAAIALFAVGGVAAVTAISLFVADFVKKPKAESQKKLVWLPALSPSTVGLTLSGGL
jgi:tetratricopeptide (TPR) repeat protein